MKKIFICFVLAFIGSFVNVNAQVEQPKLQDNFSISLTVGAVTPLSDFGKVDFGKAGLQVEKGIT